MHLSVPSLLPIFQATGAMEHAGAKPVQATQVIDVGVGAGPGLPHQAKPLLVRMKEAHLLLLGMQHASMGETPKLLSQAIALLQFRMAIFR